MDGIKVKNLQTVSQISDSAKILALTDVQNNTVQLIAKEDLIDSGSGSGSTTVITELPSSGPISLRDNTVNTTNVTDIIYMFLPENPEPTIFHKIIVQMKLNLAVTGFSASDFLGTNYIIGTYSSTFAAGNYYLIYTYNNLISSWVCEIKKISQAS